MNVQKANKKVTDIKFQKRSRSTSDSASKSIRKNDKSKKAKERQPRTEKRHQESIKKNKQGQQRGPGGMRGPRCNMRRIHAESNCQVQPDHLQNMAFTSNQYSI